MTLSRGQWEQVLADAEPATFGEVVAVLGDRELVDIDPAALVEDALANGTLVEEGERFGTLRLPDPDPAGSGGESDGWEAILDRAQDRAGREWWEPVEEEALRAVLGEEGHAGLLDGGELGRIDRWKRADLSEEGEEPEPGDIRWYYARGDEPRVEEFRRFNALLTAGAPDDYVPWYFRVERAGKAPDTRQGSWKEETARLTAEEAVEWLREGGNVGIAGRPDGPLANIDVDDDEETTPDDLTETLRATSRSRSGWHGWVFNPDGDIPNLPADELGEIRTDWQYVVAPGSFVASAAEEIPDSAENAGYYTVAHEAPVATIDYDGLPQAFREWDEANGNGNTVAPTDAKDVTAFRSGGGDGWENGSDDGDDPGIGGSGGSSESAVFGIKASDLTTESDASDRWSSLFHGSDTSANMSLSEQGKLQCWRHSVAHGGLQALATFSEHSPSGDTACRQIGTGHKHSNAGRCAYKGDWRLIWWAWEYAKNAEHIPDDDPIPYAALLNLAVSDGVVDRAELVERESDDGGTYPGFPDAATYNAALEHVREEYDRDPGREPYEAKRSGGGPTAYPPKECEPPTYNPTELDIGAHRDHLAGDRFEEWLNSDGVYVSADDPGVGKTSSTALGAGPPHRDLPDVIHCDKHSKAAEIKLADHTPEVDLHLKGTGQPIEDCCMKAVVDVAPDEIPECPRHGHPSEWELMCPIKKRDTDDPLRRRYEAIAESEGEIVAHLRLGLFDTDEHPWHGGECPWCQQFEAIPNAKRIVAVHEYQLLSSLRKYSGGDEEGDQQRLQIIDESPRSIQSETEIRVQQLALMGQRLGGLAARADRRGETERAANFQELGDFADAVADALLGRASDGDGQQSLQQAAEHGAALAALDPPTITWETRTETVNPQDLPPGVEPDDVTERTETEWVDPENLPPDVAPEDVTEETVREYLGQEYHEGYREREVPVIEDTETVAEVPRQAETLAQLKIAYTEAVTQDIVTDEWDGAPLQFDALLAAAREAGLADRPTRQAMYVSGLLEHCPWCGGQLKAANGARVCADIDCGWDERQHAVTRSDGPAVGADAVLDRPDPNGPCPDAPALLSVYTRPAPEDLPQNPHVLDATASREKIAGVYGEHPDDVTVRGDEPVAMPNLRVTQVVGGQHGPDEVHHIGGQYHASTIKQSEAAQRRIQNTIDKLCDRHRKPLFGIKKALAELFTFPENAKVLHYGGARGLDRNDCDAVCCIGAPHPDMDELRREARLLVQDNPALSVGGEEHSTRPDAPNPPEYRALNYEDENGNGLSVATKSFTGVVGALFREARERELEQFVHRIRPLLADELNHAYLLTDVPTNLRVDSVVGFEELADPVAAFFPVPEGALDLAECIRDVAAGNGPDGFRADQLVDRDGSEATFRVSELHRLAQAYRIDVCEGTVRNWTADLVELGLLDAGAYEQRRGVPYSGDMATLESALSVLSNNGSLEVALKRRLRRLAAEADGTLDWLATAREAFGLAGDRCALDRGDPTPG